MLTQERLRLFVNYDPLTGVFTHRLPRPGCFPGQVAGATTVQGYRTINIDGERFRAARLAHLYMTGKWPDEHVDHINGNQADDRWENLREATRSENMCNRKLHGNNTSGVRGVSWNKRRGQWHARVNFEGQLYHVGYFSNLEEATKARDVKAAQLHGAFARFNNPSLVKEQLQ